MKILKHFSLAEWISNMNNVNKAVLFWGTFFIFLLYSPINAYGSEFRFNVSSTLRFDPGLKWNENFSFQRTAIVSKSDNIAFSHAYFYPGSGDLSFFASDGLVIEKADVFLSGGAERKKRNLSRLSFFPFFSPDDSRVDELGLSEGILMGFISKLKQNRTEHFPYSFLNVREIIFGKRGQKIDNFEEFMDHQALFCLNVDFLKRSGSIAIEAHVDDIDGRENKELSRNSMITFCGHISHEDSVFNFELDRWNFTSGRELQDRSFRNFMLMAVSGFGGHTCFHKNLEAQFSGVLANPLTISGPISCLEEDVQKLAVNEANLLSQEVAQIALIAISVVYSNPENRKAFHKSAFW